MKKRIICLLLTIGACCSFASGIVACAPPPATTQINANVISADLLDGRVANFMGASGLGVLDKNSGERSVTGANSPFSATLYNQEQKKEFVQKKIELVKETKDGHVDVCFYDGEKYYTYKDLNNSLEGHHHQGEACTKKDCSDISDEITELESRLEAEENKEEEVVTIISLGSRVNKLYNYGNFTFMSVSSAVEGALKIHELRTDFISSALVEVEGEQVLLNAGTGGLAAHNGVSFIRIPAMNGVKESMITIKKYEDDTDFNKSNYWCNSYNQSYVIDNRTGKTYSLEQFPYIYSVECGIIKVYNENANGYFDYYTLSIQNDQLIYNKLQIPDKTQVDIPYMPFSRMLMVDVYGNVLIKQSGKTIEDADYDQNGEKRFGKNIIVSAKKQSIYDQIATSQGSLSFLLAKRYLQSDNYHYGSDQRIYRLNFKGNLSEISVSVLDKDCKWQDVDDSVNVTFDNAEGLVLYKYALNNTVIGLFRITEISNGYAYYSTAGTTDGGRVWDAHCMNCGDLNSGDYVGVVKIPVNGPIVSDQEIYEHLEFTKYMVYEQGINLNDARRNFFLIGNKQMLFLEGSQRGKGVVCLADITTGEIKRLGFGTFKDMTRESIYIEEYGWISLKTEVDFENFSESSFTAQPREYGGGLDAYFKFVTEQISNPPV